MKKFQEKHNHEADTGQSQCRAGSPGPGATPPTDLSQDQDSHEWKLPGSECTLQKSWMKKFQEKHNHEADTGQSQCRAGSPGPGATPPTDLSQDQDSHECRHYR
ncbi:uncharacterized, partial [Tachysurus ichikawai]